MFRRMLNQQRGLPRRNQMPMRTNGNFGGGFALNPALSGLSTITQPRNTNQMTQFGRPIFNKNNESYSEKTITEPINGIFYNIPTVGANGNILNKDQAIQSVIGQDGKIIDPISGTPLQGYGNVNAAVKAAESRSQNITPQMQNKINNEITTALDNKQTGQQITNFNGENGERTFTPDDQQSTIDNAALQERLKGRYDAPGYTKGQKIAAIAGVLGDVFSAPGDRNKTATIMQTIEAQRAGDMKRQQQKASAEIMEKGLSNLSPELQALARANPEAFYSAYLPSIIQDESKLGTARIGQIDAGTKKTLADIGMDEKTFAENVRQFEATFEQRDNETKLDYDFRVKQQELDEVQRRITNQRLQETLDFNMSDADRRNVLDQQRVDIQRLNALNKEGKTKDPTAKQSDNAMFYTKALTAFKTIDGSDYNPAKLLSKIAPLQVLKGEDRDTYETAGDAFIQAILRPESGAVIGPKEMIEYRQTYLPQRGDSKKALEFKRQLRLSSMNSLALGTGGLVEPYNPDAVTTSVTPSVTTVGGINYLAQDQ